MYISHPHSIRYSVNNTVYKVLSVLVVDNTVYSVILVYYVVTIYRIFHVFDKFGIYRYTLFYKLDSKLFYTI